MSMIIKNLKEALRGESKAQRKYELFAEKAEEENLPQIARLFKAVAFAESIHIKNHLRALEVMTGSEPSLEEMVQVEEQEVRALVSDTKANLQDAIDGETYETKTMYKNFEKAAKKEGENVAELSFNLARKAEDVHRKTFSRHLKWLEKGKAMGPRDIYVCQICGNVEFEDAPEECPVCEHNQKFFKQME